MTFNEFVDYIKNNIKTYLPETFADCEIKVRPVNKMNASYTGLSLGAGNAGPVAVVDLDKAYRNLEHVSLEETVSQLSYMLSRQSPDIDTSIFSDYEAAKEKLFIAVGNQWESRNILSEIPHKDFDEMVITYRILVSETSDGLASTTVTNAMLEELGVDPETLHRDAVENSMKLFPPKLANLQELFVGSGLRDFYNSETPDFDKELSEADINGPLVLTSRGNTLGAAAMFYPGIMEKISDRMGGDMYILPSSTHEVILVKKDESISLKELTQMVRSVNLTMMQPEEKLADKPYGYDWMYRAIITLDEPSIPEPMRFFIYPDSDNQNELEDEPEL